MKPNGNVGLRSQMCNLKSEVREGLSEQRMPESTLREGALGLFEDKLHAEVKASPVSWRHKEAWQNDLRGCGKGSEGVEVRGGGSASFQEPGGGGHFWP